MRILLRGSCGRLAREVSGTVRAAGGGDIDYMASAGVAATPTIFANAASAADHAFRLQVHDYGYVRNWDNGDGSGWSHNR